MSETVFDNINPVVMERIKKIKKVLKKNKERIKKLSKLVPTTKDGE